MSSKIIEFKNLAIGYEAPLFQGLNQSVEAGEVICLIGENGVGKTTFLKTLSGLIPSLSGEIKIAGQDLKDFTAQELATQVSIVLTEREFPYGLTVLEVLELARSPYTGFWGRLGLKDRAALQVVIESFQLTEMTSKKISDLSDGQRQRVMIARALVQETDILILDEPTTFLDLKNQIEIFLLLKRIASQFKKTILLTSHHWELMLELSTKLWLLDQQSGSMSEMLAEDLILSGDWEAVFGIESAYFDLNQGRFRLQACEIVPVQLAFEDQTKKRWCLNALGKWGFYESSEAALVIRQQGRQYVLQKGSDILHRSLSLLELINNLRSQSKEL